MYNEAATAQHQQTSEQPCPNCGHIISVHPHYVTWCDRCEWNLKPHEPEQPRSAFHRLYAAIGQKSSESLLRQLTQTPTIKPGLTATKLPAFSLAALVHGLTALFAALGVLLLARGWPNLMAIVGGALCLGAAWSVRPRVPKLTDDTIARESFPALYKVADEVAQALGTSAIHSIVFTWEFNAAFAQVGWRRKKIVYIGLPLFTILDDQEKIALLAHELAHGANGDPARSWFVGTAIDSLATWHSLLQPYSIWSDEHGLENILVVPFNLLRLGVSQLVWLALYLLSHLLWRESQRAEYLADYLAAKVAGAAAMLSVLDKLHLGHALSLTIERAVRRRDNQVYLAELRQKVVSLPARELERVRRVTHLSASRLDATHPPTLHRIDVLKAHDLPAPRVQLSADGRSQLASELASV